MTHRARLGQLGGGGRRGHRHNGVYYETHAVARPEGGGDDCRGSALCRWPFWGVRSDFRAQTSSVTRPPIPPLPRRPLGCLLPETSPMRRSHLGQTHSGRLRRSPCNNRDANRRHVASCKHAHTAHPSSGVSSPGTVGMGASASMGGSGGASRCDGAEGTGAAFIRACGPNGRGRGAWASRKSGRPAVRASSSAIAGHTCKGAHVQ